MRRFAAVAACALALAACDKKKEEAAEMPSKKPAASSQQALRGPDPSLAKGRMKARVETTMGGFTVELFGDLTPLTVGNFVGLATGKQPYRDPRTGETTTGRFYDGLTFHRVIPDFMIQGGDPRGDGTGGPGYRFEDEIVSELTFSAPGLLAMANAGPATNGSQFFVTVAPTPHLNGKHTIFGRVIEGYEVVEAISRVRTGPGNRPVEPVVIQSVRVL